MNISDELLDAALKEVQALQIDVTLTRAQALADVIERALRRASTSNVTQEQFEEFKNQTEERFMTTQADIDALTAGADQLATDLATLKTDIGTTTASIQTELDALVAANPGIDITALSAALSPLDATVQALDVAVKALGSATPDAPAPAASDTAAPADTAPTTTDPAAAPSDAAPAVTTPATDPAPVETTQVVDANTSQLTQPVYTTTLDPTTVSATAWPSTGYQVPGPTPAPLFYFSGDTAGSETANGVGQDGGAWLLYTGPIEPVPVVDPAAAPAA